MSKNVLLIASISNVRFKGGIYFIAQAYLKHIEQFRKNGWDIDTLSTCQIKNRDINKVGVFYWQNILNFFRVMMELYKTEKNSSHDVWYCLTSTGLGFIKDVVTLFVGNIFFKRPKKILNIQFSKKEMVIPRKIWIRSLTKWMIVNSVNTVIVQTEEMKNAIKTWVKRINVEVIYNFCEIKENEYVPKPKGEGEPLKLLYLSMISKRKGFHLVLELMNTLKNENVELHVAGDFMDEGIKDFTNQYIYEHQLSAKITFHGFVEGNKKEKIIQDCDIFMLLSDGEGMAMALLEAMNSGLAVILSDIESNRIATGKEIPVFNLSDLKPIAVYIQTLLSDDNELLRQKKHAFQRSKQFSIATHIEQLCGVFDI
jgi:glycosyltransferase involved in cell wall biosynthesis